MIRVCHIITQLELGGAQQNTLYTVTHLDRSRFEPILITGTRGLLDLEVGATGARVHRIESLRREVSPVADARALVAIARILERERPRIVHTHSSKAGILGRWAACIAGIPSIVHSIHGYGFHRDQPPWVRSFYIALERWTGRLATTAFVAVSRANLEQGRHLGILPEDRVSMIRSGIRLDDFRPAPAVDGKDRNRPVVVGMVACLKPQKAPLDFVRVASRVLRSADRPDVRFVLVGDGELRPQVESMVKDEGLEDAITLTGWSRHIPALMRTFDLLLHTSRWEGLPRVFPEAMATGLPIVATSVDGAPEAIEDGVTGFLLSAGDVDGLARRTLELVRDPEMRRAMGARARGRVRPWDIDDMVRRQERLYEGLVAGDTAMGVSRSTQWEAG